MYREAAIDDATKQAYRFLIARALLHLRYDLACVLGGFSWNPAFLLVQLRLARQAALRAYAFHNLVILSAHDFNGFSEERFWEDIERFQRDCPRARGSYRDVFERFLKGERGSGLLF